MSDHSPEVELHGATAQLYISDLDQVLVAHVDTIGVPDGTKIRVNLNDGRIWDADPEQHHHTECTCINGPAENPLPAPVPALAHTSLQETQYALP
ncbi:hypothetical protein [Glutamicibacter sp. AOP5-A2-18]|uniref:hypothetical protein n=1 Tax=Glutamicibacter sp. AOP5-A2-18 TaxID=3457656 RepID=UPI0040345EB7